LKQQNEEALSNTQRMLVQLQESKTEQIATTKCVDNKATQTTNVDSNTNPNSEKNKGFGI
jgi:hypothetical protein